MSDASDEQAEIIDNGAQEKPQSQIAEKSTTVPQRKIPGNLPYLTASGSLKKVLDKICEASRPDRFTADFLENVLKLSGGSARATIPVLKKMGFLNTDGSTTDLYAKFRTNSGRPQAALQGLKNAFPEIFRRSEHAASADDRKIKDIVVEITGLSGSDSIVSAIRGTFNVVKSYIPSNFETYTPDSEPSSSDDAMVDVVQPSSAGSRDGGLRLSYNINIVLPETSDLKVLNAIFKSIRDNLMQ